MKILIVSATLFEVKKMMERYDPEVVIPGRLHQALTGQLQVTFLTTGIGLLQTSFHLGKELRGGSYDLAINAGICGAYQKGIPLGSVVHVTEESLPELGYEENGTFYPVFDLGLISPDTYPFEGGKLINTILPGFGSLAGLKKVRGNSVNTLNTDPEKIDRMLSVSPAEVESMEGAGFLFGCLHEKVPCAQIRAVSNYVGERDKGKWKIRLALVNLDEVLGKLLEEIRG